MITEQQKGKEEKEQKQLENAIADKEEMYNTYLQYLPTYPWLILSFAASKNSCYKNKLA